jgi:hypothetical protein
MTERSGSLGWLGRLEPLHLPLSPGGSAHSHSLPDCSDAGFAGCLTLGSAERRRSLPVTITRARTVDPQKLPKEALHRGRHCTGPERERGARRHPDRDGTSELVLHALVTDKDFIHVPRAPDRDRRRGSRAAKLERISCAKRRTVPWETSLSQQQVKITQAEGPRSPAPELPSLLLVQRATARSGPCLF